MVAPSGEQFEISGGGYTAVVTEAGATLRSLAHQGRAIVDGFAEHERSTGGRGQLLMPWPNRVGDGRYEFGGDSHRLALTEPARENAIHGLVRWSAWTPEEHMPTSVSLTCRLMAQPGYPWALDLHVVHDLSADGLTVTQTATNLAREPAPYACGAHPYLLAGPGGVDDWELLLPADTRLLTDERGLPTRREHVGGTPYDFRVPRPVRGTVLDHAFTDLSRDADDRVTVTLRDAGTGTGVALWGDAGIGWLQAYTGDGAGASARRSLAVEPMTAPPDAFRSREHLVVLAPAGSPGDECSVSWGIRALE